VVNRFDLLIDLQQRNNEFHAAVSNFVYFPLCFPKKQNNNKMFKLLKYISEFSQQYGLSKVDL